MNLGIHLRESHKCDKTDNAKNTLSLWYCYRSYPFYSGTPTTSTSLPGPAVTVEGDDGVSTDNSSGSPADSGNFKIWTLEMGPSPLDRRSRIPDEKTPGHEAINKSSVPHLHPQKGRERSANELISMYRFRIEFAMA
ncbi:hypothetical protein EVAR_3320_1 [Eumeta japonica]|uniref:Uncharacterized protein n=1 Tax=Eumeta variegata TaxID=151549 RepID=A0A4C1SYM6_EUMVA|nr:hypothetical protein EVAR_3320_1 [Eumeta japonica]